MCNFVHFFYPESESIELFNCIIYHSIVWFSCVFNGISVYFLLFCYKYNTKPFVDCWRETKPPNLRKYSLLIIQRGRKPVYISGFKVVYCTLYNFAMVIYWPELKLFLFHLSKEFFRVDFCCLSLFNRIF